jgi:PAS domain S-box-containing protein
MLIEAVTDYAIYMLDRDGYISSWNPGAQRFKGYVQNEILGQHFSRFYTEEDRLKFMPQRALETAARVGNFEAEGWRVRKNGERFWAHVVIDAIRDPGGEVIGFAKITRDLTERRAADVALRESEERFRLLVQGVTDYAIYMLDPSGRITNWNLGGQRLKGYLPEEIVGEHFSRFYLPEDREAGEPARGLQIAAREGRFEKEGWRLRKDGSRFFANVVIDAIRDESGTLLGFAKVTRDITEKRESELALEKARNALLQSQKMEAIGQLTGGVAHDFNNLLMAIMGSLELLEKRMPDDAKARRLLANAVEGAQRGAALTKRMLTFARRQDLDLSAVDVGNLVRGMRDLLQRSMGPTIEIDMRLPPDLPQVLADAHQLELALLNLMVNARDAMSGGGIVVVGAREQTIAPQGEDVAVGQGVCLYVTDTGVGMDAGTLQRAMEPFFTTKGVGRGTGLGLSMVHGLAKQSGGRLTLRSDPDHGTTAEIWLPAMPVDQAQRVPPAAVREAPEPTRRLSILAVDDDHLVLMNTGAMLEDLGHRVVEAASGRQAIEVLETGETFDLLMTDVAMPHMGGLELAEMVKARWPELPVMFISGYAEMSPACEAGMPRLSKPFMQVDLARALAEFSRRHLLRSACHDVASPARIQP